MIDINFLNGDVDGLENLRYQKDRGFYLALTEVINDNLTGATLDKAAGPEISRMISTYAGFDNVTVDIEKGVYNAFAHGTAFFTPTNILRGQDIENYLSEKDSLAFKALKKLDKEILLGWVDYATGKVCGDFAKVKCLITIDSELDNVIPVEPKGLSYGQAYALIIMHEVGHFFNACAEVGSVAGDDYVGKMAVHCIANEADPKKKMAVLKHASGLIELPVTTKELEAVIETGDLLAVDSFIASKVMERDKRRTLSLGVTRMSAEVLADAYAVRMGGGIDVAKMTDTFRRYNSSANRETAVVTLFFNMLKFVYKRANISYPIILTVCNTLRYVATFQRNNVTNDYNTPERRTTDIIKQVIQLIRDDKLSTLKEKTDAIKVIDELRKVPICDFMFKAESLDPFHTAMHRILGQVLSGGTWSRSEYIHYTASIANHEVNLVEHKLAALLV